MGIGARPIVRVIKTETRRAWRERDPPHTVGCNVGRAFLRCAVYVGRHDLAVPMQLLQRVRVIGNVNNDSLPFLDPQQWSRELTAVRNSRNDSVVGDLHRAGCDSQSVISLPLVRLRIRTAE